eukprot:2224678-Rhodomonas_salina.1
MDEDANPVAHAALAPGRGRVVVFHIRHHHHAARALTPVSVEVSRPPRHTATALRYAHTVAHATFTVTVCLSVNVDGYTQI